MTAKDRLWISLRQIRGRLVESTLVIVATTIGVALVAAMVAFIVAYNNQTDYLLNHPAYRELLVEVIGEETELAEPVQLYDAETTREIRLGVESISDAMESVPAVDYGYLADRESLSTGMPGMGGFAGRGGGGIGGFRGAVVEPTAPEPTDGETAESGDAADESEGSAQSQGYQLPEGFQVPEDLELPEGFELPEGIRPPTGMAPGSGFGRRALAMAGGGEEGESGSFDLEEFFESDPDVVTDLPLDSFAGGRVTAQFFDAYDLEAASGSLFTTEDVEEGNQVVVLGSELAEILFPDTDPVGTRVRLNLQTLTIIGVLEPTSLVDVETNAPYDRVAFVPNGEAQISFGGSRVVVRRPTLTLRFAVSDSAELQTAAGQLQAYYDAEFGEGTVRITAPIDELRSERQKLGRVLSVVLFLAAAGLFIASINVFNLMLMRVIKRTKNIGISRAIGSTTSGVFRQFFSESALMTIIAAAIGLAFSPVVYRLLGRSLVPGIAVQGVDWVYLIIGAVAAALFTMLFGAYPARQAARIDAAVAIRTE